MVQRRLRFFVAALVLMAPISFVLAQTSPVSAVPEPVQKLIKDHCLGCHGGKSPSGHLSLEPDQIPAGILNRPSRGNSAFKLIDTAEPDKSYILMKLRGADEIKGGRMPKMRKALKAAEIQTIADWIKSLAGQGT